MKKVTINLYEYSELSNKAKEKAISEHEAFLLSIGNEYEDEDGNLIKEYPNEIDITEVIDSIEGNEYLFYSDGNLANVTHYCGKHPKAGNIELKLGNDVYQI
jgi:hypothetical protein